MDYSSGAYRQPYRYGDYHLVDARHRGTYWQSADGMVVRLASAERKGYGDGEFPVAADVVEGR
ncbi:MAG: hypothetical protein WA900_12675 [Casimicrobiaceae bacterium]